jgi:hypothetical protein
MERVVLPDGIDQEAEIAGWRWATEQLRRYRHTPPQLCPMTDAEARNLATRVANLRAPFVDPRDSHTIAFLAACVLSAAERRWGAPER